MRALLVGILLATSLSACAREPAPVEAPPVAEPPLQAPADAGAAPAEATAEKLDQAAQTTQETTGEAAAENGGDATLERLAALPDSAKLPSGRWKAGQHYTVIVPAQPTDAAAGRVEINEVFWYGCGHCYSLEPYLASWKQNKADYIDFVGVPVMWGPVHRAHARLYYTLQALDRLDLHSKVFDEIHQRGNLLADPNGDEARSRAMQLAFARDNGISEADFLKAYDSFSVGSNLQRADQLTRRYRVEGVPLIIIAGKYKTDVGSAGNPGNLLALMNDLAASEKQR